MRAWQAPTVPTLPQPAAGPVLIHDSSTNQLEVSAPGSTASFYACGITPYDATHIGHANTYVAFDLLYRAWLDAGKSVHFAQNITDVDDPLLERATATGVDWRELALSQIELFREDMSALRVLPPQNWVTVTEAMPQIIDAVTGLVKKGASYFDPNDNSAVEHVETLAETHDVYFDIATDPFFGTVSNLRHPEMLERFAGHGGDPERPGKHNALDPILWRAHRPNEPEWDGGLIGIGRPGWHIGCTVIANGALGIDFDVTGGGKDLLFPHHEMSSSLARVLYNNGGPAGSKRFMHCGLISYQGEKMSKSLGNLVLVSQLRHDGVDPMAIRLTLLSHHYRTDWEWTDAELAAATTCLNTWRNALATTKLAPSSPVANPGTEPLLATTNPGTEPEPSFCASPQGAVAESQKPQETIQAIRTALANDLNAPAALTAIDNYFAKTNRNPQEDNQVQTAIDALLGVVL